MLKCQVKLKCPVRIFPIWPPAGVNGNGDIEEPYLDWHAVPARFFPISNLTYEKANREIADI
jgi:hypothetical protein